MRVFSKENSRWVSFYGRSKIRVSAPQGLIITFPRNERNYALVEATWWGTYVSCRRIVKISLGKPNESDRIFMPECTYVRTDTYHENTFQRNNSLFSYIVTITDQTSIFACNDYRSDFYLLFTRRIPSYPENRSKKKKKNKNNIRLTTRFTVCVKYL